MAQISTLQKYTTIIEEFKKRADATLDAYDKYLDFLQNIQNSMTLYGEVKKLLPKSSAKHR